VSDTFNVIILGIVEGIFEFLPVSSTGHLLVAEQWLGARTDLFNVAIQAGAILAIVLIYWKRLLALLTRWDEPANRDYLFKLVVAFVITGVGGFTAVQLLGFKLPEAVVPIAIAFLLGGVAILFIEQYVARKPLATEITWNVAFWVGVCQFLAGVLPGTSRSAATIFAAMLAGVTARPAATEFAFLVGIPTMFAATGLLLWKSRHAAASEDWSALALGFVVSGIVAFIVVKWLLRYVQSHRFTLFAWYRIAFGAALLLMAHAGIVR
jgi:undecaprenyl-diphosphatase